METEAQHQIMAPLPPIEGNNDKGATTTSYIYKGEVNERGRVAKGATTIIIDPTVTKIRDGAFSGLSVTSIQIPPSVTEIGQQAFACCRALKSIVIPSGITEIKYATFYMCDALESIVLPDSVTTIGSGAFSYCISLPRITIPASVTCVGERAFEHCTTLKSITIPSGVTEIKYHTFDGCVALETVFLSGSITSIGSWAFFNCTSLQKVTILRPREFEAHVSILPRRITEMKDSITGVDTQIGRGAFENCSKLYAVNLPHSLDKVYNSCTIISFLQFLQKVSDNIKLKEGPGPKYEFKGSMQRGYGPEMWGVTLGQMEDILKKHPDITHDTLMRDVVKIVIKPATRGYGIGYGLLVNQNKPLRAKVMVSHAWDEPFGNFVSCLKRSGHPGPFWVCAFSIYQSEGAGDSPTIAEQIGPDPEYGAFSTVLKGADLMLAVVTEACDTYTRLWCVYEILVADKQKVKTILCPYIPESSELNEALENDICVANVETAVDSMNALCWDKTNNASIQNIIKLSPGEFIGVNQRVEMVRLNYLLNYPMQNIKGGKLSAENEDHRMYITAFVITFIIGLMNLSISPLNGMLFISGVILFFILHCLRKNLNEELDSELSAKIILIMIIVTFCSSIGVAFGVHAMLTFASGVITTISMVASLSLFRNHIIKLHEKYCFCGQGMIANLHQRIFDDEQNKQGRKDAISKLVVAIESTIPRTISSPGRHMISFEDFCKTRDRLYNTAPTYVFRMWAKHIKSVLDRIETEKEKDEKKIYRAPTMMQTGGIHSVMV